MPGTLIAFEGIDGCGKSTQLGIALDHLTASGLECLTTREPGGTPGGEAIRDLLLDPDRPELSAMAELCLFCASRSMLVADVIEPALAAGTIVLSDRFDASSVAYQGHAGGVGIDVAEEMIETATAGRVPDLTLIFDLDPGVATARLVSARVGDDADHIEGRPLDFQHRVREGYLLYAQRHTGRCVVLDGGRSGRAVANDVWEHVKKLCCAE